MTYLLCRELCVILKKCKKKSRDVGGEQWNMMRRHEQNNICRTSSMALRVMSGVLSCFYGSGPLFTTN